MRILRALVCRWPLLLVIGLSNFLMLRYLNYLFPIVGHDYNYHLPRMIDIQLHYLLNGPSIQWFTPTFGGGIPGFPNPISSQFSIHQTLYLFLDLWTSVEATLVISNTIGIIFTYKLIKALLNNSQAATLGALFFSLNGFVINHLMAGHLPYHLFCFIPVLLHAFAQNPLRPWRIVLVTSAVYGLALYSAGVQLLIVISMSVVLCALFFENLNMRGRNGIRRAIAFIAGVCLAGTIASAKLYAALSFMHFFERNVNSESAPSIISGIAGMGLQLLGFPFLWLLGFDVKGIFEIFFRTNGNPWGLWEHDTFVPLMAFALIIAALLTLILSKQSHRFVREWLSIKRKNWATTLIALIALWISVELITAQGILFPFLKTLPIFKSLRVNIRYTSAMIMPIVLAAAMSYHFLTSNFIKRERLRFALFISIIALSFANYLVYENRTQDPYLENFDMRLLIETDKALQKGERFIPVRAIDNVPDFAVFAAGVSNARPYEPIFGSNFQDLKSLTRPGPVTTIDSGYYNMNHPASIVYPFENQLDIWERIPVTDKANFEAFINRRQPDWKVSKRQTIAGYLSIFGIFIWLLILARECFYFLRHTDNLN